MVKVCSYRRSGTNYLMALMALNFRFDEDLKEEAESESGNKWILSGKTKDIIPWGKLFGTHNEYNGAINVAETIYIYRHPIDVLRSLFEFVHNPGTSINNFVTDTRIKAWKDHVDGYINAGAFPVRYDQLCTMPVKTLTEISKRFEIPLADGDYCPISQRVGWAEKNKMNIREGYNASTLNRFKRILGEDYRGFRI